MNVPRELKKQLQRGRVIPFVGAGVSMAVQLQSGDSLFPSWKELLARAAKRMEDEDDPRCLSPVVQALLHSIPPDYLEAAKRAQLGLGSNWYRFLKDQLDHPFSSAKPESLLLARKAWELGSQLVITTNYDRVLHWSCPREKDLHCWDIESPVEQAAALSAGLSRPTVWHLHGYIDNAKDIILTPDGYSKLYPTDRGVEPRFEAALRTLHFFLTTHSFLFIGYSLSDELLGLQIRGISDIFSTASGPHYALIREKDVERVRALNLPIEIISISDNGPSLIQYLTTLGTIASNGNANGKKIEVETLPRFRVRIFHSPKDQMAVDKLCSRLLSLLSWVELSTENQFPKQSNERKIEDSINKADAVIMCSSSNTTGDVEFIKWVEFALDKHPSEASDLKCGIPVLIEEIEEVGGIRLWPQIPLFEDGGFDRLVGALRIAAVNAGFLSSGSRVRESYPTQIPQNFKLLSFWNKISSYKPIAVVFPDAPCDRSRLDIETSNNDFMAGMDVTRKLESLLGAYHPVTTTNSVDERISEYVKNNCCVYIAGRVCNPRAKALFEQIQGRMVYKFDRISNSDQGWIASESKRYESIINDGRVELDYGLITAAWCAPDTLHPQNFLWAAGSTGYGTQAAATAAICVEDITDIMSQLDQKANGFQVLVEIRPTSRVTQLLIDTLVSIDLNKR